MRKDIWYLLGTVFGLGMLHPAPGTWGSLGGLALCLLLHKHFYIYSVCFMVLFVLGVISAEKLEKRTGEKDPSFIVIDEFACIFAAFLFVPLSIPVIITGFILYRVIDIIKLPPMAALERVNGGWGIMLDDLASGIYTNMLLQALLFSGIIGRN